MKFALVPFVVALSLLVIAVPAEGSNTAFRRGQVSGVGSTLRSYRINTAIGFGGLGLGLTAAGALLVSKAVTDSEKSTAAITLGLGIGLGVGAILRAVLRNPYERSSDEFLRLSANEDGDAVERRFQKLVAEERKVRRFQSILGTVFGGALIGIGLLSSTNREIFVGFGAGAAAASLFTFLFPPELPFESLGAAGAKTAHWPMDTGLQLGLSPIPGGAAAAAAVRF